MADVSEKVPRILEGTLDVKQGALRAVRYNVDGNYCISCGSDKTLKLWNPTKKKLLKTYSGHGYEVLDARGSSDNSQLVSCGLDKTVILWDVTSGSSLRKWRGHAGAVNCVKFNEDSSVVISGSLDCSVKIWDVKSKKNESIQTLTETKDSVTSIDVSDHEILIGCVDKKVRRYDLRNGKMISDYIGNPISSACFTRDGQCLLVSSNGSSIKLIDKSSGELLQKYEGHSNKKDYRLESVLNDSDQLVLSGSEDGFIYVWDLVEGTIVSKLDHSVDGDLLKNPVHSLTFHPSGPWLLSASRNLLYIWKTEGN